MSAGTLWRKATLSAAVMLLATATAVAGNTPKAPARRLVATEGKGYLETVGGYRVLHLKGTPEQMGRQHGRLLKQPVTENVNFLLADRPGEGFQIADMQLTRTMLAGVMNQAFAGKIPEPYVKEMRALADGAGLPADRVIACNLIPEMFHCSGFALLSKTTAEKKLYHGRILDYGVDQHLQDHAVLIIQQPDGKVPFVNVSYAGFIGSVTGMNVEQVSIGEMGGGGVGMWSGVPMSFLVRMVLDGTRTLDEAVAVFKDHPRTCEYYYVIADARRDSAVGLWATPDKVEIVKPGQAHDLLPTPVPETVILSAFDRYTHLVKRIRTGVGTFTPESAIRLMDAPVAMKANLHNVLMIPADGVLHVANAAGDGAPAWKQPYYRFDVRRLMAARPGGKDQ
jgi:isopenicillin-N N-acyltransferase-like protein